MTNQIVNISANRQAHFHTYIGRGNGMNWGNPYTHLKGRSKAMIRVETREDAIASFRAWMLGEIDSDLEPERRQWMLDNLLKLDGKILGCHCAPLPCHGEVLFELVEKKKRGEI